MKKGIDISYWQGNVDFEKVKKSGIEFVILREGYRKTVDKKFFEYVEQCRDAGLEIFGVYHFIYGLTEQECKEEALSCLSNLKKAGLDTERIVVFTDFEYDTVTKAKQSGVILGKAECNKHTIAFCETIRENNVYLIPGIYTNLDFYKNWYDLSTITKYKPTWLADYTGDPDFPCLIQQYSSKGTVPGISGYVDLNYYFGGNFKMDENVKYSRQAVVDLARSWIGKKESDGSYREIIDIYNSYSGPFPRGVKMQYSYAWCACTWSALAIKLGYTEIMPIEISCGELIKLAQKMGIWVENDGYIPSPGDAILYDWDDDGKGDNTGWPDHVGVVEYTDVDAGYFVVIEGNYNDSVKRRTVSINGRYIRGFITPLYDAQDGTYVPEEKKKDIDTIAHEVIAGLWGNGDKRKSNLEQAGYNYDEVQARVNEILNTVTKPTTKEVVATCDPKYVSDEIRGDYVTTADLYLRNDVGKNKKALCVIPKGTSVHTDGSYGISGLVIWPYVEVLVDKVLYKGFCSSSYLTK